MRDSIESIALNDALPADEQAALKELLASDPALADAFGQWKALRASVGADLRLSAPDSELLVLFALGEDAEPSADEAARLDAARADLESAFASHPALTAAVNRIRKDRDAFEESWAAHLAVPQPEKDVTLRLASSRPAAPMRDAVREIKTSRTRWVWRIAALVAVAAFGSLLTFLAQRDAGFETIKVAEARSIVLPDGSTVDLAAGSSIQVPEADGGQSLRQARLMSGRALFRVAHDPAAPFTVTTTQAEVTVLGTVFGVTTTDIQTDVVLVSGAVTLAPRERPDVAVLLTPGQQSRVVALDAAEAPSDADIGAALSWTGTVFARDENASAVADRIGARFGVTVSVAESLAREPISGEFAGTDGAEDALNKLALALGAEVSRTPDGFRIVGAAR